MYWKALDRPQNIKATGLNRTKKKFGGMAVPTKGAISDSLTKNFNDQQLKRGAISQVLSIDLLMFERVSILNVRRAALPEDEKFNFSLRKLLLADVFLDQFWEFIENRTCGVFSCILS